MRAVPLLPLLPLLAALAGCQLPGLGAADAAREAEGRAVGAACRHAGRAIEDCYVLNARAGKAAVFAGWREMNDYMRENDIREVAPQLPPPAAAQPARRADDEEEDEGEDEPPPAQRPSGGAGRAR